MEQPLVSIVCTTYNHQNYIKDALESFLKQQTNFPIEIIVHDDASSDSTPKIIESYERKYPHLFKCIYQKENWYSQGKNIWRYLFTEIARGQYIAICEGDDYWVDPLKLEKQVVFLKRNEDYGLVYTDFYTINEKGAYIKKQQRRCILHPSGDVLNKLIKINFIQTVTVLGKKDIFIEAIKSFENISEFSPIDYALFLEIAHRTKISYFPQKTSAYRIVSESASHSNLIHKRMNFIENVFRITSYYNKQFSLNISESKLRRGLVTSKLKEYSLYKKKKLFFELFISAIFKDFRVLFSPYNYYHLLYLLLK